MFFTASFLLTKFNKAVKKEQLFNKYILYIYKRVYRGIYCMSEFIPKINGEKIENRNVGSSEVTPPVNGSEKFPVFEFTPMPDFTFDYGDEYVAHTKINQVPTKLTMNLNTGKISAGYRADDITLSKIVDRTTEAAGIIIEEGAKKAAEGVGQVCSDVADYMAPKFQAIGDAWYYSDIGAL